MAVNHVNLIGNLTRDAALQNTNNGTPVMNFTLAFSEQARQQDGTYKAIPQYVDGSLRYHNWDDHFYDASGNEIQVFTRNGQPKSTKRNQLQVIVDEFEFCNSRNNGGENEQSNGGYHQQPSAPAHSSANGYDDDVPF